MDRRQFPNLAGGGMAAWLAGCGANCARLQQVKKACDPDRALRMAQCGVPAARAVRAALLLH